MEEKIIEIKGKKIKVSEVKFVDTFKPEVKEKIESIGYMPAMLSISTDLTLDEIKTKTEKIIEKYQSFAAFKNKIKVLTGKKLEKLIEEIKGTDFNDNFISLMQKDCEAFIKIAEKSGD